MEQKALPKSTMTEAADRVLIIVEKGQVVEVVSDNPLAVAIFDRTEKDTEINVDCYSLALIDPEYITNVAGTCEVQYEYEENGSHNITPGAGMVDELDDELDRTLLTKAHK